MLDRRQRLEYALSIMPYNYKTIDLSEKQKQVDAIIARLSVNEPSAEEESADNKELQQQNDAQGFAEQTMREIEEAEGVCSPKKEPTELSTLDTLTLAAEKLQKTETEQINEEDAIDDDFETTLDVEEAQEEADRKELMENTVEAVNEAYLKVLERWEISKRKVIKLLSAEIDKIHSLEQAKNPNASANANDKDADKENKKWNAARPDDGDEDYVPCTTGNKGKRKRAHKPNAAKRNVVSKCPRFEFDIDPSSLMITIGPNGTQVSRAYLNGINWAMSGPAITRKLLCEIFDRSTLAFHTLSGKPSPAFKECARPSKQQLDPLRVADLVYLMTNSRDMTAREVRTAITTKCADENKMLRTRLQRPRKTI